jgi:predicted nucleic acid-binding protein
MGKPLIFDSTPLIHLTKASLSKLLSDIPAEKFTTQKVFDEVVQEGKKRGAPEASLLESMFREKTISMRNPTVTDTVEFIKETASRNQRQPLHEAEAEVLSLAKELNGVVIADDKAVRTVGNLFDIEVHGTGYILGKLYATGKLGKAELIEKVAKMRASGWYVSSEDYFKITQYLNSL